MPDSNRPDLLTPKTAIVITAGLALPVALGRLWPTTVAPIALLIAAACAVPVVDMVEGKRRSWFGTIAVVLTVYVVAVLWPWGRLGLLPPIAVALWAVWGIGAGRGSDKRKLAKVQAYLPSVIEKQIPPGTTLDPFERQGDGKIAAYLRAGPGTPKGAIADLERKIGSRVQGLKRGEVTVVDLGAEVQEGLYRIEIGSTLPPPEPFSGPKPPRPALAYADKRGIPIGFDGAGNVIWIANRLHGMVAGETGSGKSNTLNVIIEGAYQRGDGLYLVDPKETELYPWRGAACNYGDDAKSMLDVLAEVSSLARRRRLLMRQRGQKNWTIEDGPFYTVIIDEMSELGAISKAALPVASSLARLVRSAGIQIWFADQYPTAETFPKSVKQNTPNVIGHRVKNGTAVRVLLDEDATAEGWNLADPKLPQGRGVLAMPGHGRMWVQVFEEGGVTPPRVTQSHDPIHTAPEQDDSPCDSHAGCDPVTPECDDLPGKYDGPVLDMLGSTPRTQSAIAKSLKIKPTQAKRSLVRLERQGLARQVEGGWVDPRMEPISDHYGGDAA